MTIEHKLPRDLIAEVQALDLPALQALFADVQKEIARKKRRRGAAANRLQEALKELSFRASLSPEDRKYLFGE